MNIKVVIGVVFVLLCMALIPPAVIARMRAVDSEARRLHYIQNMDNQPKYRAQHVNDRFADDRAMRPRVAGTISREEFNENEGYLLGYTMQYDDAMGRERPMWLDSFPGEVVVDRAFVEWGRNRFEIYCQPCHGAAGYGDGIVHQRGMALIENAVNGTTWVEPKSLHEEAIRDQAVGQTFNSITNGVRNMAGYGAQVPTWDRWAIVAYVRALQRSQHAQPSDLAPGERENLETIDLIPEQLARLEALGLFEDGDTDDVEAEEDGP